MTKLKLLLAALIATAMLAAPAMAREGNATSRHVAMDANASAATGTPSADGRACHLAPAVGAFATAPWDNGPPCEPGSVH
jgi:hypothetical protein